MTRGLRTLSIPGEDLSLIPSIHVWQLTVTHNFRSGSSNTLLAFLGTYHTYTLIQSATTTSTHVNMRLFYILKDTICDSSCLIYALPTQSGLCLAAHI